MIDFETVYLRGKTVEELIDQLADSGPVPGSPLHEVLRLAIAAKLADRVATPRLWAMAAAIAAAISAATAIVSVIATS